MNAFGAFLCSLLLAAPQTPPLPAPEPLFSVRVVAGDIGDEADLEGRADDRGEREQLLGALGQP